MITQALIVAVALIVIRAVVSDGQRTARDSQGTEGDPS